MDVGGVNVGGVNVGGSKSAVLGGLDAGSTRGYSGWSACRWYWKAILGGGDLNGNRFSFGNVGGIVSG